MSNPHDPIHQDLADGYWYFWDETWADRLGPYLSEVAARHAIRHYCDTVLKSVNKDNEGNIIP